ncbi:MULTISPECIES: hypothetical protein [Pseudomonas]|jgi:hypothetical protein|uniref:Lipoprotein n=1 Tax=Pseudomonas rustica TaxID=2827099 RepID=A0ABS5MU70_9PSED|nr:MULTISPECIES: hypothetical protein [Pseudomonas]MBS4077849.1 hypothetical protein [Pseudomonas rustica]MBS4089520.1 hypothetical protein [Pseudomonas rustica]
MHTIARITVLTLALGLSACAVQRPEPTTNLPPIPPSQPSPTPSTSPTPGKSIPAKPAKPVPRTSASFAPPPGGNSHWDQKLGVYVLDDQTNTFYRQRTYYRWNNGWSRSISPNGPWEDTNIHGVPPGLGKQFGE